MPKPKTSGRSEQKLKKSQPDFFETIGSKGGSATLKNHGKLYFSRLAKLSHARRRKKSRKASVAKKSGSGN